MYVLSGCISDAEKLIIDESTRPTCVLLQMAEIEFYFFEMPPIIILLDDDDNDNNARIKQNGQSNYCADINGTVVGFLALRSDHTEREKEVFLPFYLFVFAPINPAPWDQIYETSSKKTNILPLKEHSTADR